MNTKRIPTILTPVLVAAAIIISMRYQKSRNPVELPASEVPAPSIAETQNAYDQALAPNAPGYEWGSKTAPVTVLEFADFGCKYCGLFARETFPQLTTEFIDAGKVRWKYVPFVLGMFPNGRQAAHAAECAAEQGLDAFRRMHDRLYAGQQEWQSVRDPAVVFTKYAADAKLEPARFKACTTSTGAEQRIDASNRLADQLGVRVTPTFFVNGARVEGALPIEEFRALLNEAGRQP